MAIADISTWKSAAGRLTDVLAQAIERRPRLWRWILAGPVAFVLALISLGAMPHILPQGRGGVDHLIVPTILLPITWAALIIWPVATERLPVCVAVYTVAIFVFGGVIAAALI
ncbi:MAG: hypothetical protein AAGF30_11110 [Pseudomonadota bacterium]